MEGNGSTNSKLKQTLLSPKPIQQKINTNGNNSGWFTFLKILLFSSYPKKYNHNNLPNLEYQFKLFQICDLICFFHFRTVTLK